jgi:replicative DNA helicase
MKAYNLTNEESIIVAVLRDGKARRKATLSVSENEFFGKQHRAIFEIVIQCDEDQELDPDLILAKSKDPDDVGGRGYLEELFATKAPKNIDEHLLVLREDYCRNMATQMIDGLKSNLIDKSIPFDECVLQHVEIGSMLNNAKFDSSTGKELAEEYLSEVRQRREGDTLFQRTGFDVLDEILTEGLAKRNMSVVCGRPGNGKTSFTVAMVDRLLRLKTKPRICVIPTEAGRIGWLDNLTACVTGITSDFLVKNTSELTSEQMNQIERKIQKVIGTDDRLVVLDNPFLKLAAWNMESVMNVTEEIFSDGYDIILTDLWARKLPNDKPETINQALRWEQYLAKKYNVHSLMVQQLNRKVEERKNKHPVLSDLKSSGAFEEYPDLCLSVFREKIYSPHVFDDTLEVEVLKQRKGPTGAIVEFDFQGSNFGLLNERLGGSREVGNRFSKKKNEEVY